MIFMRYHKIKRCKICGKDISYKCGGHKYCNEHRSTLHQKAIYLGMKVEKGWYIRTKIYCGIITGSVTTFTDIAVCTNKFTRTFSISSNQNRKYSSNVWVKPQLRISRS